MMRNYKYQACIAIFCFLFINFSLYAVGFQAFPIATGSGTQGNPDIDGKIVVYEDNSSGNWNIKAADITTTSSPTLYNVVTWAYDQRFPKISKFTVVWQDKTAGNWDIWTTDIANFNNPVSYEAGTSQHDQNNAAIYGSTLVWQDDYYGDGSDLDVLGTSIIYPDYPVSYYIEYDYIESRPAIWKNTVIWQSRESTYQPWQIMGTDITDPRDLRYFAIPILLPDEPLPAISNDIVVWQDTLNGNMDIYGYQISDMKDAQPFAICTNTSEQSNPDIDNGIVVWQDNRNGNWDIYGYNIATGQEFQITDNPANQTNPSISGNMVIWEDIRNGNTDVYGAIISGTAAFRCETVVAGDLNKDCRVDYKDLSIIANRWLYSNLE